MNTTKVNTRQTGLQVRARTHAALADPARLQIVDLLAVGDQSPTRLREALGISSNLLAHHLGVLEQSSIVRRRRSDGDGRRSYVSLESAALERLGEPVVLQASSIVFVCTANSARSQLAQAMWNTVSDIPATSAGTHPADGVAPGAVEVARRHGLDLSTAVTARFVPSARDDEIVITVCDQAHEELGASTAHWSVPDPVGVDDAAAFEAAFDDIARRVARSARLATVPAH
jgi:protein-tyrosine-phosphatase/DNA-binding HxlR family transcriptional regulator